MFDKKKLLRYGYYPTRKSKMNMLIIIHIYV